MKIWLAHANHNFVTTASAMARLPRHSRLPQEHTCTAPGAVRCKCREGRCGGGFGKSHEDVGVKSTRGACFTCATDLVGGKTSYTKSIMVQKFQTQLPGLQWDIH